MKEILDRLDDRISRGFGDFTAIQTEIPIDENGLLDTDHSALYLMAQNGRARLWCRYLVGEQFLQNGRRRAVPTMNVPKDWPHPNIEDVMQEARSKMPSEYIVSDGQEVWPFRMSEPSLSREIWFGREGLLLNTPGAKAQLLRDASQKDLIGVHAEGHLYRDDFENLQLIEHTCWFAPEQDDMPVKILIGHYGQDGKTVVVKITVDYCDYTQLSDGRWYPIRWRQSIEGGQRRKCNEFCMQIFQEVKLDKSWFADPQERLKSFGGRYS